MCTHREVNKSSAFPSDMYKHTYTHIYACIHAHMCTQRHLFIENLLWIRSGSIRYNGASMYVELIVLHRRMLTWQRSSYFLPTLSSNKTHHLQLLLAGFLWLIVFNKVNFTIICWFSANFHQLCAGIAFLMSIEAVSDGNLINCNIQFY